jgi:hypothetical protein
LVFVGDQFSRGWRLTASDHITDASPAFGWALGFPMPSGAFSISYGLQWIRTTEMLVLGLLWLAALWITRRPAGR